MAKSLDGIKKLNPDDIKKYRKIVLDYIGEKDSAGTDEPSQSPSASRKVDGINLNKISRFIPREKTRLKKLSVQGEPAGILGEKKEELAKSREREEERLREAVKRQEEERKKIEEEERQYQIKREQAERLKREKVRLEKEYIAREEIRRKERNQAEAAKKSLELEQEEKRKIFENLRLEKIKRQEKIAKIKLERQAAKQKAKENHRIKRQEAIKKIRQNINNKFINFFSGIKQKREKIKQERERERRERINRLEKDRLAREQAEKEREEKEEKARQERAKQAEIKKQEQVSAENKLRERQEIIKREELRKKEIAEQVKREAKKMKRVEEIRKREEKIKLAELEKEEKRKIFENLRLEKIKRQEEIARIKLENKIARQAARAQEKIKRRKAWKKIKSNFKLKLNNFFSKIRKNMVYIISLPMLFLAIVYIIICLAVLRLKADNIISRTVGYLPVPAVITNQGIITYLDYKKIENKDYLNLSLDKKKNYLANWVILRGLKEKYGLPANIADDDLAVKYVLNNEDLNQVALARINQINKLLKGQGGVKPLGKYADEYNDGVYFDAKSAAEKFGSTVLELAVGQISDIMPRADGYYIVEKIDDKNGQLGVKYIFIKAQTLNQHVSNELGRIKVFILAN